jgi:uncharacterized protein DUF222
LSLLLEERTGEWLVAHRVQMERGEAVWLQRLADFDLAGEWAADGQYTCVDWLSWRLKMARSTAYEKLQVAHELRRRPIIASAFEEGRLSYSAVRVITRIENPDPEVDEALIALAEAGTVGDLEKAARFYKLHADQDRPLRSLAPPQTLGLRSNHDGTTTLQITLPEVEVEELLAIVRAFVDRADASGSSNFSGLWPAPEMDGSAAADTSSDDCDLRDEPVDQSAAADGGLDPADEAPLWTRMARAFVDMARVALQDIDGPPAAGADRYMVHVLVQDGHTFMLDGTPIEDDLASRIACEASIVTHLVGEGGEPLALGRKTREWSTAQRRVIVVRDGGICRFPGCTHRRFVDIHHHRWWSRGGPTDVDNGYLQCTHHHDLVHKGGYLVEGDPNGTLTFYRPGGTVIGSTTPRLRTTRLTPVQARGSKQLRSGAGV